MFSHQDRCEWARKQKSPDARQPQESPWPRSLPLMLLSCLCPPPPQFHLLLIQPLLVDLTSFQLSSLSSISFSVPHFELSQRTDWATFPGHGHWLASPGTSCLRVSRRGGSTARSRAGAPRAGGHAVSPQYRSPSRSLLSGTTDILIESPEATSGTRVPTPGSSGGLRGSMRPGEAHGLSFCTYPMGP